MVLKFPKGFLWGSATSAYQVEGGIRDNDWARFFDAGQACDHYNRYEEDFDLLKRLGQNCFRLSIEWSRIEPKPGKFDKREIEHYRKVLLALKSRKIKAMVTLYHFTLPWWLAKIGGFANSKVVFYFSRYSQKLFEQLGDLVDFWITINEPLVYAFNSCLLGIWPPAGKSQTAGKSPILFLKVIKNQIKTHKKIYEIFHKSDVENGHDRGHFQHLIGIAKNNIFFEPNNPKSPLDKLTTGISRYFWNEYFLNKIKNHLDFIGLNYYFHRRIKFPFQNKKENKIISDIGWEIYPQGIYQTTLELKKYNLPVCITENGLADAKDEKRKDFIKDHLFWLQKAISQGADVRGYLHWSLMDNFEWEKGFEPRFGLIEIDYKTLERKPRPSSFYYGEICKRNSFHCG